MSVFRYQVSSSDGAFYFPWLLIHLLPTHTGSFSCLWMHSRATYINSIMHMCVWKASSCLLGFSPPFILSDVHSFSIQGILLCLSLLLKTLKASLKKMVFCYLWYMASKICILWCYPQRLSLVCLNQQGFVSPEYHCLMNFTLKTKVNYSVSGSIHSTKKTYHSSEPW